ncbi:MAG: translation initiation factor IF-6 [Candidatus Micrarchaeota archaeon]|nr:translation initiation factor IF-6 [Candidatus Micrarchaeota archaeon]MBU1682126.1 translation initiation factor IF-6 [Candidatus Micrarchaeota archaeon]
MIKTTYFGNPWIGMFIKTNDEFTMLPIDSMKKLETIVEETLKTEIIKVGISDSNLLGVYLAMNSNGIILPNVIAQEETDKIKKSGLNVYVSKDSQNANGNNIAANDKAGIVNPHLDKKEVKKMEDALDVELVPMMIAGHSTVGSTCIATNNGFLTHFKTSSDEMEQLKDILKVRGNKGTINTGTGYVSYGVVVNSHGYVAGEATTAFELGRVEEALGLIK